MRTSCKCAQLLTFLALVAGISPAGSAAEQPSPAKSNIGERSRPRGSVYVPLDSWVYPALRRLAALGYIKHQVTDIAPWTRLECLQQVQEAETAVAEQQIASRRRASLAVAESLLKDLQQEFESESSRKELRLESIYSRATGIGGTPLNDSYHFGRSVNDDFGRPYASGFNNVTGVSGYGTAGRFSAYVRGEYQEAPQSPGYTPSLQQFVSKVDGIPARGNQTADGTNRVRGLEMYAGAQWGWENITFGQQSLWWGPGQDSAFSFSNNAAPVPMVRIDQTHALVLPGVLSHLGRIKTEFLFGQLTGHHFPARPYLNAQKISLDLTDDFEVGFTRSAIFGGAGRPLTFQRFRESLISTVSVDYDPYGASDLPGDRHSDFDFRWRIPGLRKYLTLYSDSYADDDPNPIDNPRRSAWGPGIYITQIPGLSRADLRVETYATWLYRKDYGGQFLYWNNQYRDSYTNQGSLLGSWAGRDARAYVATAGYWFSGKTRIAGQYRQTKSGSAFLPGGGTQTDASVDVQWSRKREWLFNGQLQAERYYVPILGAPRHDVLASLQVTFTPQEWAWRR